MHQQVVYMYFFLVIPRFLSGCRSWLSGCHTSWNCGTEYEYEAFSRLPLPPCAFPEPDFKPPVEPGICEFNLDKGVCEFNREGRFSHTVYQCLISCSHKKASMHTYIRSGI